VIGLSQSWARRHNRAVTYVYLLLPGVNDTDEDLRRLTTWFAGRPARINLMRWNPVEGGGTFERVDDRELSRFRRHLLDAGVPAVVRDTQGRDIEAACGQLWLRAQRRTGKRA
jgi:23S rRNA (adenine2503-C2)-methyltransferase